MMSNDDFNRGNQIQQGRKSYQPNRYNPGSSYNYNYGYNQNPNFNGQQHPRRRADRFKRESLNINDRLAKQNDMIIRLLKEIRDRLPPPAETSRGDNGETAVAQQEIATAGQVEEAAGQEQETPQEVAVASPAGENQQSEVLDEKKNDSAVL